MKFGAGVTENPVAKGKGLITELINKLQAEASHKSYCDEELSKTTAKKQDLESDVAKHFSRLESAVAKSNTLDGEIAALHSPKPVGNDTIRAEGRKIFTKAKAYLEHGTSEGRKSTHHP